MTENSWDQRFSGPAYAYGTEPNDFVASMAYRIPDGPVLCLAEGEGRNAVFFAGLGRRVTAVDLSAVGLEKARRLAESRGVEIAVQVADLADYEIGQGAWAGIVATWAHLPPPVRSSVHARVAAGLRPGGVYVLEAYTPAQVAHGTGGPKEPSLCMTLADLRRELAGLEFLVGRECEREVREGIFHTGRSAVVQICARRPA